MNKKTFKEVIADIKDGEVWESDSTLIKGSDFGIEIEFKYGERVAHSFFPETKYKLKCELKRNKYTFIEAFKAYEEGTEIESVVTCYKYIKTDGIDNYKPKGAKQYMEGCNFFDIQEIRGEWFING